MLRIAVRVFAFIALSVLSWTLTADADCYTCGSDQCCTEAASNTSGFDICTNDHFCYLGCSCNDCVTAGTSCEGGSGPGCDNPNGICEEHQSLKSVPNGEPINLLDLIHPPIAGDSVTSSSSVGLCYRS